jgi:hypothetical protein
MSDAKKFVLPFQKSKPPPPAVVTRARHNSSQSGSSQATHSTASTTSGEGGDAKKVKRPKQWHPQQEIVLKQWAEIATSFRWMHHQTHLHYSFLTFWLTLPVILLSSITGTLNFAQSSIPPSIKEYAPIAIGSLNLIAGAITTVASYLRVSELAEGNRVASVMFGKLSRNIRVELLLPLTERTMDGDDFIAMCRSEMDRLTEQTPDIPRKIERRFADTFRDLLQTDFYPPELMELHPVEVYRDEVDLNDARTANVLADAAMHFKKASERVKAVAATEEVEAVDGPPSPVPSHPAPVAVAHELQQLSTLQTVSNMLRRKQAAKHGVPVQSVEPMKVAAADLGDAASPPADTAAADDANVKVTDAIAIAGTTATASALEMV